MICGENTKGREIISNGRSDPNEWSHLRAMRKPRKTTEKTIANGDGATMPLSLERNKLELKM